MALLWRLRTGAAVLAFIAVASVTALSPVVLNAHLRFRYVQTLAHYASKIRSPSFVFAGDSITAGGRNWGWRIGGNPLDAINLGANGLTVRQIRNSLRIAEQYRPRTVFVLAGTNDVLAEDFSEKQFRSEYSKLLDRVFDLCEQLGGSAEVILAQIPMTSHAGRNGKIRAANRIVEAAAESRNIALIDLNELLAPSGVLTPDMTTDGVHLSEAAYGRWAREITRKLNDPARPKCGDYRLASPDRGGAPAPDPEFDVGAELRSPALHSLAAVQAR